MNKYRFRLKEITSRKRSFNIIFDGLNHKWKSRCPRIPSDASLIELFIIGLITGHRNIPPPLLWRKRPFTRYFLTEYPHTIMFPKINARYTNWCWGFNWCLAFQCDVVSGNQQIWNQSNRPFITFSSQTKPCNSPPKSRHWREWDYNLHRHFIRSCLRL